MSETRPKTLYHVFAEEATAVGATVRTLSCTLEIPQLRSSGDFDLLLDCLRRLWKIDVSRSLVVHGLTPLYEHSTGWEERMLEVPLPHGNELKAVAGVLQRLAIDVHSGLLTGFKAEWDVQGPLRLAQRPNVLLKEPESPGGE